MKYPYYCTECEANFDSTNMLGSGPWRCHVCHTHGTVYHIPTYEAECVRAANETAKKIKQANGRKVKQ
jgi:hypothetical protein